MMQKTLFICGLLSFLCSAQALNAKDSSTRILILGDSLTEGYGVSKNDAFPALLEKLLNQKNQNKIFKVVAAGSSGSTTASAFKRLKWHLKKKPELLVLALGGNDGLRGLKPEATKANLDKAITFAKAKKIKVVLAGMKIPMNYGEDYREAYEKTFTDLSKKHDVFLIPFLLKGVGGVKDLNLPDGIHPNEKGHRIISKTLYKHVKSIL